MLAFKKKNYLFIWLHQVLAEACGIFSAVCELSHPVACGILVPDQESTLRPLHWKSESESEVAQSGPTLFDPINCVAHQAPLSMEFSRKEYWSGLPFPSPGDLPDPGIKPGSVALWADSLPSEPPGKPEALKGRCWIPNKSTGSKAEI